MSRSTGTLTPEARPRPPVATPQGAAGAVPTSVLPTTRARRRPSAAKRAAAPEARTPTVDEAVVSSRPDRIRTVKARPVGASAATATFRKIAVTSPAASGPRTHRTTWPVTERPDASHDQPSPTALPAFAPWVLPAARP